MTRNRSTRGWSWLGNLKRLFTGDRADGTRAKRRRLVVEPLEGRNLLSATVFPTISGTAFYDVKQDGLGADDLLQTVALPHSRHTHQ